MPKSKRSTKPSEEDRELVTALFVLNGGALLPHETVESVMDRAVKVLIKRELERSGALKRVD